MQNLLNNCPICGSELEYCSLWQSSYIYKITTKGKISATRKTVRVEGPMECGFLQCSNDDCDFITDCDLNCERYPQIHIMENNGKYVYTSDDME